MSGPLHVSKITVYQGVDQSETRLFFVTPASGSTDIHDLDPLDFTGCSMRMMVRLSEDPTSTQVLSLTAGAGLAFVTQTFTPGPPLPTVTNGVQITITKTQSLAMNSGVPFAGGYYDLLVDQPGGLTLLLMAGPFDLAATVTR